METWKWWHIAALILEIIGIIFLALSITTDLNDELCLPAALGFIAAGNLLIFIMAIRQNRKNGKK